MTKIFVFGSNLAGRHTKGAATYAKENYGAEYGIGKGRTGYAYAIPTKDFRLRTLTLTAIKGHVEDFLKYAKLNPNLEFILSPIQDKGHHPYELARMFTYAPNNVKLPEEWASEKIYGSDRR